MYNENQWLRLTGKFQAAAVGVDSWLEALADLAAATGSRAGQLIGLGSECSVPFNWVTDLGPDWVEDFLASGGGDPATNPFVRAGTQCPPLSVRSSEEFVTREERRSLPFLTEHARRFDIPYICLAPLHRDKDTLIGLAVIRSRSQGEITDRQRALFTSVAPHVQAAVRSQILIEHQGAALVAGAMEALSLAAFICDGRGKVQAMTPQAERLLLNGDCLKLHKGQLTSVLYNESRVLLNAVTIASHGLKRPAAPVSSTLLIRGHMSQPLAVEIMPLPRGEYAYGFVPRVLIVVRNASANRERAITMLQAAFGLTPAEADIASRLQQGHKPEAIAQARGSAVWTVRAQIRSVYAKCGVSRASELIAKLNHYT